MSYPGSPPPPPWANITGISRTVMKDNAQETIGNYNGNARPGEIVADLTVDPPTLYIGNNLGQLTLLNSGGGSYGNTQVGQYLAAGLVGNIIPSGNGVYSLGNSTNWWSNVWLTGNTLYIGGVPVGMSGNSLTVNGSSVTTGDLNILGTNIGIANGVAETTMAFGGTAANVIVDTDPGAPKINIYAQSTGYHSFTQGGGDYTSAEWVTDGGGGAINITGAQSYFDTFMGELNQYSLVTITINGTDTVPYNGASYGGGSITIYTNTAPATSPTAVTDIEFNLTFENGLYMDPDEGDMLFKVGDFNLNIRSQRDINITSSDDLRLLGNDIARLAGNANVTIVSAINTDPNYAWIFDTTGNLNLPSQGNIVGITPNNAGHIQWVGNSSGDGGGYTTLRLVPDDTRESSDSYVIIDPTGPSHIHIRAGGTQDDSGSEIYLGGEKNYFRVTDGSGLRLQNETTGIQTGNYFDPADFTNGTWFTDSGLYYIEYTSTNAQLDVAPYQDINEIFVSWNSGSNSSYLTYGGSTQNLGGGVYKVQVNEVPPAEPQALEQISYILNVTRNSYATLTNHNFEVSADNAVGVVGKAGIQLTSQNSTDSIRITTDNLGNVYTWEFGVDGNLTLPTEGYLRVQTGIIGAGASPAPSLSGFSSIATTGLPGNITASGNLVATAGSAITIPQALANLTAVAGARAFVSDANLVAGGNFGNQISGGGSNTVPVWSDGTNWYIG